MMVVVVVDGDCDCDDDDLLSCVENVIKTNADLHSSY